MSSLSHSESVTVASSPDDLYDLVCDVARIGEWSPVCTACWWDEGDSARVGARFTGRNEIPGRTWETRCEVVAAQRGREFAFVVGESYVRWGFTFTGIEGGTQLTESWDFLPAGIAMFQSKFGADADREIADRTQAAHHGIPVTLAAIKKTAETV